MSMFKEKDWKYGIKVSFWTIGEVNINYVGKYARFVVFGYRSQEARIAGEEVLETIGYDFNASNFPFVKGEDTEAKCYEIVKQSNIDELGNETNFFADSIKI